MDPATKQYVDSTLVIAEGRSDAKLAEFRSTIEAYTARADEREAAARDREVAAREREAIRAKALEQHMRELAIRADERAAAAREREALSAKAFEQRMSEIAERAAEREAAIVERENIWTIAFGQRMDDFVAVSKERQRATEARFDRIEASIASLKKIVVGASLSTVLGVGAVYAALVQNYHAAFDSARYLTTAERDVAAQRQRTEALLTAVDARLAAMQKAGGQQAPSP